MLLDQINMKSKEGKLLAMLLSGLTDTPFIKVNSKTLRSLKITPQELLDEVERYTKTVFPDYETK